MSSLASELDFALHQKVVNDSWNWNVIEIPGGDFEINVMYDDSIKSLMDANEFVASNG